MSRRKSSQPAIPQGDETKILTSSLVIMLNKLVQAEEHLADMPNCPADCIINESEEACELVEFVTDELRKWIPEEYQS